MNNNFESLQNTNATNAIETFQKDPCAETQAKMMDALRKICFYSSVTLDARR